MRAQHVAAIAGLIVIAGGAVILAAQGGLGPLQHPDGSLKDWFKCILYAAALFYAAYLAWGACNLRCKNDDNECKRRCDTIYIVILLIAVGYLIGCFVF